MKRIEVSSVGQAVNASKKLPDEIVYIGQPTEDLNLPLKVLIHYCDRYQLDCIYQEYDLFGSREIIYQPSNNGWTLDKSRWKRREAYEWNPPSPEEVLRIIHGGDS